ncbi:Gamma-butyrobetaine dioxygenase [Pseudocercospora fuligena]|uniref:Gamma-butyrobetaine dioxygenase n=1 Tax=Pseudocercospora fuligena TaxID=685502 RepID=A0A8H6RLL5_9PEZI|nr:Gamma-butyrobetaine dioxygenase [Pseudocercospora fuligena]
MAFSRHIARQCQKRLSNTSIRLVSSTGRARQSPQEASNSGSQPQEFGEFLIRKPVSRIEPRKVHPRVRSQAEAARLRAIQTRPGNDEATLINIAHEEDEYRFAPISLRDLCQCSKCVDPSTRQKLVYTPDIPSDIRAKEVTFDSGNVSIKWENDAPGYAEDHVTTLPLKGLMRLGGRGRMTPEQAPIPRAYWNTQMYTSETSDFDYEDYMSSDSTLYTAARQLHTHGLLFVTNVPEDEESVERVAERIGPLKTTFYGKTWDVRSVPEAKNVAYTAQNLGFHMDLMYMKQPPHLQLLHCIRSSSAGGASLFADSFLAAKELSETDSYSYATLSSRTVEFHYDHPDHYYHQSRRVIEEAPIQRGALKMLSHIDLGRAQTNYPGLEHLKTLKPIDFLESVAWSPPFQGPFKLDSDPSHANSHHRTGQPIEAGLGAKLYNEKVVQWHAAAKKFNDLIHRPEVIYERLMKPGECVIFDNRRVLHARKAFEVGDAGKERWLRGAYIDKDPFMSKLKILSERFEKEEKEMGPEELERAMSMDV